MDINISIYSRRIRYEMVLNSSNKINIIRGNSGTGKTTLCGMLQRYNNGEPNVKLECSRECILANSDNFYNKIMENEEAIIIMDEDDIVKLCSKRDERNPLPNIIASANNYFVFITRRRYDWLPVDISAMYALNSVVTENNKNKNILTRLYEANGVDNVDSIKIDKIVTEDSKSGNIIMERHFDCKVETTMGKDNIVKNVLDDKSEDTILIVLDACKYGWHIDSLREVCKRSVRKYYIFRPDSIEGYILRSPLLKCNTDVDVPIYNIEKHLEQMLKDKLPLNYTKSNASKCILNECGCDKKCNSCEYRTAEKKRDAVIYGELEVIEPKKY